jgi:hypothetical protein
MNRKEKKQTKINEFHSFCLLFTTYFVLITSFNTVFSCTLISSFIHGLPRFALEFFDEGGPRFCAVGLLLWFVVEDLVDLLELVEGLVRDPGGGGEGEESD